MNFSAASLVKKSAAQLLYLELNKPKIIVTDAQLKGNKYSEKVCKRELGAAEKRGIIQLNKNDTLFFCVDLVIDNRFIEIKNVDKNYQPEDWYLESSILQTAFYTGLLKRVETLDTPKFRIKEGYDYEKITVPSKVSGELWFGDISKFKVKASKDLVEHYIKKAKLISGCVKTKDYTTCKEFDKLYKFNEFRLFKPKFKKL